MQTIFYFSLSLMAVISHYFNQISIDSSHYFAVNGFVGSKSFTLFSAKWLFSSDRFDLGTRILLKNFHADCWWNVSLLDLWCGYGLVSTFIASQYSQRKFPDISHLHIDVCDSSSLAVDVATYNMRSYIDDKNLTYHSTQSDILSDSYFDDKLYTLILVNPPFSVGKRTVTAFIEQSYTHLKDWWIIRMVAPTKKWAKSYVAITEEIFGKDNVSIIALEAWYRVWTAKK
jgi:16S rRNA G1207 methylase RsmC